MSALFRAKTREGYIFKVLAELLHSVIKTACFEVDATGIRLQMMDENRTILINLELEADNFCIYKFRGNEKLYLGINLAHFHKMLKPVKKRDSIELFIGEANPIDLVIQIIPKENNRVTTSYIKIQNIQYIDVELPEGYGKPVIVPSGEFQKMCKGLTHISNVTHIVARRFHIRFSSDASGVMKRDTEFGEKDDTESEDEDGKAEEPEYSEDFETDHLTRITKIAGLSTTMQIYPKSDKPLLFRSNVGGLGKISIYLKSRELCEAESRTKEDSDEE